MTTKFIDADEDYGPNLQMSEIDEKELEDLKEKFMQKLNKTADEIMSISQLTLVWKSLEPDEYCKLRFYELRRSELDTLNDSDEDA
ncbi:hypothetical protein ILUMI_03040 [Ignelater luminosus]|uniref:Uncharacterized protein n=1 Tax=Ignelater luminosus TaxID=2038154 RepID=A0A8K0DH30_IGNLU|nr:hypothetical protein ILUMI_03040 [Ignelater luminosus]